MKHVEITRIMMGFCHMQVCAEKDATDEKILEVCNTENPSGTRNGWGVVVRKGRKNQMPTACEEHSRTLASIEAS